MAPTQNSKTEKKTKMNKMMTKLRINKENWKKNKNEQNDDKVDAKQRELLVTIFSTLDIPPIH